MASKKKPTRRIRKRSTIKKATSMGRRTMSTPTSHQPGSGKQEFEQLLNAIGTSDAEILSRLREHWHEIRQYVESFDDDTARSIQQELGDKYQVLALWCSTPPTPLPVDWSEWSDSGRPDLPISIRKQREDYISLVNQLWESWQGKKIIEELEITFKEFRFRHASWWLDHAVEWFSQRSWKLNEREVYDLSIRLDVIAGYNALIDQLLFDQEEYYNSEARILVLGRDDQLVLKLDDEQYIDLSTISSSLEDISGVSSNAALQLSGAISFSLPVYRNVLPTVSILVESHGCFLRSNWEDPLSGMMLH